MQYLYETHLHTEQGSACGKVPGRDYIRWYRELGYAGIMVTDHFFHGNARPDRALSWDKWVNEFCSGYEDARAAGEREGLQVFFGIEERFEWDEWLIYGLTKEFLLDHPDMREWGRAEYLRHVRAAGGCIVQAHPFRVRPYITNMSPCLGVDGIEIGNAGNTEKEDGLAVLYAQGRGKFVSAGSDVHWVGHRKPEETLAVVFSEPLRDVKDYVNAVLTNREHTLRLMPNRGKAYPAPAQLDLPCTVYGEKGEPLPVSPLSIFEK